MFAQSYGLHHKQDNVTELITYVDYVEVGGAAHLAGMRPGEWSLRSDGRGLRQVGGA